MMILEVVIGNIFLKIIIQTNHRLDGTGENYVNKPLTTLTWLVVQTAP